MSLSFPSFPLVRKCTTRFLFSLLMCAILLFVLLFYYDMNYEFKTRFYKAEAQANNNLYLWIVPSILTILALWTRLYKISWSNRVVW